MANKENNKSQKTHLKDIKKLLEKVYEENKKKSVKTPKKRKEMDSATLLIYMTELKRLLDKVEGNRNLIAEKLNLHVNCVHNWCNKKGKYKPSFENAIKLNKYFGIDPNKIRGVALRKSP